MAVADGKPGRDCPRCPRLAAFRSTWRVKEPGWFNAPVPSFGPPEAKVLFVGLAPGMHGANRTGRPFTGDYAGILLYETLYELGLATASESLSLNDGLKLQGARIANAVKCVPPGNKPLPDEIRSLYQSRLQVRFRRIPIELAWKASKLDRFSDTFGINDWRISEPLKGKQLRSINMIRREGSI